MIFLPGLALLLSLTSSTLAQEHPSLGGVLGRMWTFENPPLAYLEAEYGFTPDQEWLDSLRLGSLRIGGEDILSGFGSASFVSPEGLIMTSTRCVRGAVTETRQKDIEIINAGFVAAAQEQEFRLRLRNWGANEFDDGWLTAAQLIQITTVTDQVNRGVLLTDNEIQIREKREANKQAILDAATKANAELVPQIVNLYQGAVVQLYQYKVYDDIRLVVLPPIQSAHFGGSADNFTYPRYSVDFAFVRAYENGEPADTSQHYFKWSSGGAKEDELVFVAGNPGTTSRLRTTAQMELERDIRIPIEIERLTSKLRIWTDPWNTNDSELDPENPSKDWAWMRTRILATENDLKAARGHRHGLESATLMAQKTAAEQAFKSRVMADEKLARQYGDLWDRIAIVVEERRQHEVRERFQTADAARVFGVAVAVVRACDPAETAAEREQARKTVESWAGRTVHTNILIVAQSQDHVVRSRSWLPEDDPYFTKVLGGRNAQEFDDAVAGGQGQSPNWFGNPEPREALFNAGWTAIQDSDDPVIVAARELVPLMRKNEKLGAELDAREAALGAEMARALFDCCGTNVSSDATNTLRFTDGVVRGFPTRSGFGGTIAPHRTTFFGLYARNAEFDDVYPFNLPAIWLDRKDAIDMTKTINFASTNDISVGNSGSVVVNRALEVVGVVVDGNIESLHNDFVFTDDVPRAVSVHVDGIMEALVKIYDADRIVEELAGK